MNLTDPKASESTDSAARQSATSVTPNEPTALGVVMLDAEWRVSYANDLAAQICGSTAEKIIGHHYEGFVSDPLLDRQVRDAADKRLAMSFETEFADGQRCLQIQVAPLPAGGTVILLADKTEQRNIERERADEVSHDRKTAEEAKALNEVAVALSAELDLQKLVQIVTDAATKLTGAKFGSFFYNVLNERGESYLLYTLSGAPREAFEKFGMMPRNTPVFEPTFRGKGVVRSDDITKDPRYGQMAPHHGMPKGHLPVRSYLAASVVSRTGEVLGGLFFGHPDPGVFDARSERMVVSIASQAAIAIDNARLFAQAEQSEQRLRDIVNALPAAIFSTNAEGRLTHFNEAAVKLSGGAPELGNNQWATALRFFHPDGSSIPAEQSPMALALTEGGANREAELIVERPDGTRLWIAPYTTPIYDAAGRFTGAINMLMDITERKSAEEARDLLGAIVDSSEDAIISKNLSGVITSWNKSAERVFGYTADEAIGRTVAALLVPEDRQGEEADILARLHRGERVEHFETVRLRKDGQPLDISLTISPVRDSNGTIVGASKIARDITDRKLIERHVQSLNEQMKHDLAAMVSLQQLSTRLVEARAVSNLLGEIVETAVEVTGAARGNIQLLEDGVLKITAQQGFDQPFLKFFRETDIGRGAAGAALRKRGRVVIEDVAASPFYDQQARQVVLDAQAFAVQSTPLITRSGEILGMFSTHYGRAGTIPDRDLSLIDLLARQAADFIERHRTDADLRASEERFRLAQKAAKIGVFRLDVGTGTNTWSAELEELYGLAPGSFAGTQAAWEALLHPEDLENARNCVDQAFATGQPVEAEWRVIWPDGSIHWIAGRFQVELGDRGLPPSMSGVNFEITERKRIEAELRAANQDLEQFAYSASHDLQEPLRTIKIYSELLLANLSEAAGENAQFLDFLQQAATRMEMLVRDLMEYTKVNRVEISSQETEAAESLSAALANLHKTITDADASVTYDKLPRVRIEHTHLQLLFQNLVSNAIKYRDKERQPAIHVSAELHKASWIFSVRDNGIGIEADFKEKIFGLFTRLHGAESYPGTGLGLAICQRIVERYHGRIWVESEPGRGSTFRFSLPV